MITELDEYPIHQSAEPVNMPVTANKNAFDRYWFGGICNKGTYYFGAALGYYPNLDVQDGHLSISTGGKQYSFHSSRRAPKNRSDNSVGPFNVEVVRPLRVIRVTLAPNKTGLECDLTFTAQSIPFEEPERMKMLVGSYIIMDTTRFCQYGKWKGWIKAGGKLHEIGDESLGLRDRCWGIRPVGKRPEPSGILSVLKKFPFFEKLQNKAGERLNAALIKTEEKTPSKYPSLKELFALSGLLIGADPGVYWLWNVNFIDDFFTHFGIMQDKEGKTIQLHNATIPRIDDVENIPIGLENGVIVAKEAKHSIQFKKGTRYPESAVVEVPPNLGEAKLKPILRFHMAGLGYEHPGWRHGEFKGEEVIGEETWALDEIDPLDRDFMYVHFLCEVTLGDRKGMGIFETIVYGKHAPSGFKTHKDGA